MEFDDENWPEPTSASRCELEIKMKNTHIAFTCRKIMSSVDVDGVKGLEAFYFLTGDLRNILGNLISMHFKKRPI